MIGEGSKKEKIGKKWRKLTELEKKTYGGPKVYQLNILGD